MKVEYINPFLDSAKALFKDYLRINLNNAKPILLEDPQDLDEVSALIGLAGEITGAVVLSMSKNTAVKVVSIFAQHKYLAFSNEVIDGVGELVNILAGNSKKDLKKHRIVISLPGVIIGNSYRINWPKGVPIISIPFTSNLGNITINVSFKESK